MIVNRPMVDPVFVCGYTCFWSELAFTSWCKPSSLNSEGQTHVDAPLNVYSPAQKQVSKSLAGPPNTFLYPNELLIQLQDSAQLPRFELMHQQFSDKLVSNYQLQCIVQNGNKCQICAMGTFKFPLLIYKQKSFWIVLDYIRSIFLKTAGNFLLKQIT